MSAGITIFIVTALVLVLGILYTDILATVVLRVYFKEKYKYHQRVVNDLRKTGDA